MKKTMTLCGFLLGASLCAMDDDDIFGPAAQATREENAKARKRKILVPTEEQLKRVRLEDEDRLIKFTAALTDLSEKSHLARLAVVGAATGSGATPIDAYHAFHKAMLAQIKVAEAGNVNPVRGRSISFDHLPVN